MQTETIEISLVLAEAFERLGVEYLVGGSLASSMHGIPRSTQDVDLVAALKFRHIPTLVKILQPAFYIDADLIKEAIQRTSSFTSSTRHHVQSRHLYYAASFCGALPTPPQGTVAP